MSEDANACAVDGCMVKVHARKMCDTHYKAWMKATPPDRRGLAPRQAAGHVNNSKHGTESRYSRGCRCDACREAHRDYFTERRAARRRGPIPPDVKHGVASTRANWGCTCQPCLDASTRKLIATNHASRPAAHRNGQEWTGPELEVALRSGLTARDVAAMLGRTIAAVQRQRVALAKDPRKQRLAQNPASLNP